MKSIFAFLFLVILILVGAVWFYSNKNPHAQQAKEEIKNAATQTKAFMQDKFGTANLSGDEIKDELSRTGQVVRRKTEQAGNAVADATADARITAAIKAKLVRDPDLSAINISVSTTEGKVTLSGTASSPENIRKAIQLAMDTDGVHEVVSTLQVKS